jgi:hypothetical protein
LLVIDADSVFGEVDILPPGFMKVSFLHEVIKSVPANAKVKAIPFPANPVTFFAILNIY